MMLCIFRETGEAFLEACPNNKRDRETLETLILKRVRLGTKILTDGWAGYKQLEKLGKLYHVYALIKIIYIFFDGVFFF